jgi:hypothetical protein
MDLVPFVHSALTSEQRSSEPQEDVAVPEEALVADDRAGLTPAQMVERKLVSLLKMNPLPVSHVMAGSRPLRTR